MNMKIKTKEPVARKWVGGFAALCLTIGVQQASAEAEFEDFRSITVSYSDLDLTRQAGIETLYKRINWAARAACGPTSLHKYDAFLSSRKAWRECVDRAIEHAVEQIDEPKLTALHQERSKRVAFG
jgi:UrcA family protein